LRESVLIFKNIVWYGCSFAKKNFYKKKNSLLIFPGCLPFFGYVGSQYLSMKQNNPLHNFKSFISISLISIDKLIQELNRHLVNTQGIQSSHATIDCSIFPNELQNSLCV
jgi:hypothetical protein